MMSRESAGYTIVEVLIVLAVTSALFVGAAAAMAGKQARTEFTTGVRSLESQIQTSANEVASGFFDTGYQCTAPGSSAPHVSSAPANPGGNIDCIFLGKILHFGLNSGNKYNVYTLVARRLNTSGSAVTTLADARPVAVDGTGSSPDLTGYRDTTWGIKVTKLILKGTGNNIAAFGFLNQLTGDIAGGNPTSGSRSIQLVGVSGTALGDPMPTITNRISSSPASLVDAPSGIVMCVSGGSGQKAEIDIGGQRGRLTTNVLVDEGVSSDC